MGGVTDGPTVIQHLKSVFPRNVSIQNGKLNLHTDNFVFRIYTRLTPVIFLILGGLIFWQRMSNEHINCYAPSDEDENIRAQAINQYCFVTGTYTVIGYPPELSSLNKGLPYPGVGPHVSPSESNGGGTEIKYHLYFQWVPFILLVQAFILIMPRYLWKGFLGDGLSRYCESIMMIEIEDEANQRITPAAKRFFYNINKHKSFCRNFISCEVISLLFAILCIFLSDRLLSSNFLWLGWDWIQFLMQRDKLNGTGPLDLIFPKMSKCEFKMFGPGGGIIQHDLLCVMTLNVIHEKVYLFQWFWLWFIILLQVINLLYRMVLRCRLDLRWSAIKSRVELVFLNETEDMNGYKRIKYFVGDLGYSDWSMLERIAISTDTIKFTRFLQHLAQLHIKSLTKADPWDERKGYQLKKTDFYGETRATIQDEANQPMLNQNQERQRLRSNQPLHREIVVDVDEVDRQSVQDHRRSSLQSTHLLAQNQSQVEVGNELGRNDVNEDDNRS